MVQRKRRGTNRVVPAALVHDICGITDPFCEHADGQRSPYGTKTFTVPLRFRGVQTITTSGTGKASFFFCPGKNEDMIFNPGTGSFPAASSPDVAAGTFPDFVDQVRVVSAGIRWWSALPATAGGGHIGIIPVDDRDFLVDGASQIEMEADSKCVFMDVRKPGEYMFQQVDLTVQEFQNAASGPANMDIGYNGVIITVDAQASTIALNVEFVVHFEATIAGSVASGLGTVNPRQPLLVQAQEMLSSSVMTGARERVKAYLKSQGQSRC